ncbi:uncharacterized protein TRUGW13939_09171 [Talaromyces rugulosus]|uniref:Ketoreductase (KR) domain-containing protein n=1 Tax=Talaromyces rugulosus TaxID=121627 RepID=A0A7H8R8Q6_TALRU|nr:uncharacterized protein TRUGW13939_09171 [Talaromyces rugulosus]QKX62015.1 hypothetical protein TRUGW13939_09171 [Talaromyces rugulosus]
MSQFTKSFLVTGGTGGLGLHASREIAQRYPNAAVVIASRKDKDGAAALINEQLGQSNVRFMPLNLGDFKDIRTFVETWADQNLPPISALLLNAAVQFAEGGPVYTTDGIEATFGIGHVGHALLFHLLQPYLADECRIVITASGVHDPEQTKGMPLPHYTTAEEVAHPTGDLPKQPGRQRYSTTKLCNVLWTYALGRRLEQIPHKKWTVVAMDPGLMPGTGLARDAGPVLRFLWLKVLPHIIPVLRVLISPNVHLPKDSGTNLAWVAVDESQRTTSAVYYEGKRQIKSSVDSYNEAWQEDLWSWTVNAVAAADDERRHFGLVGGS